MTPLERHLRKWMEKAIMDFGLIEPGDGVAVGVSGGKDSLALARLLSGPMVQATKDFRIVALHVDGGIPGANPQQLARFFEDAGVEYEIIPATDIFEKSHAAGTGKRPCYLCSRMRRKALLEAASRLGLNKIALAHHRDDAVETLLMNMCFNREISTMLPRQELFGGSFSIIRPLYYIRERLIARFAQRESLPVQKNLCPMEDASRRRFVKDMLREMEKQDPLAHGNIFRSAFRVKPEYMPKFDGKIELPREI